MRAPRMSSCAPTGVAIFLFRAICPSKASSAMAATVSPTAVTFAHAPRPNRHTARNPTTPRRKVTLFGVHRILSCRTPRRALTTSNGNRNASLCSYNTHLFSYLKTDPPRLLPLHASQILHLSPVRSLLLTCFLSSFCASKREGLPPFAPPSATSSWSSNTSSNEIYGRIRGRVFESPWTERRSRG